VSLCIDVLKEVMDLTISYLPRDHSKKNGLLLRSLT